MSEPGVEPVEQPIPPRAMQPPVDLVDELAHKNTVTGLALFGLALVLFAGTFLIAFVYLALN
ncbi:MAG TPA: hypothetical protein VHI55_09745 [Gaiellaceae bacterium]|nr:hypothetical protein [Gaiellaceae bacterium]